VLVPQILSFCQGLTAEPYQDRFTDTQWYQWISQAQREVARETRAIEGRKGIQVQSGFPEYTLPRMVSLKRVYIAGPGWAQRITHTSIPQMEGDQLRIYDQSGANQTPQWLTLPAAPYPVENCDFNTFGYNPLPMFPGRRPAYYLRGIGRIGLVPVPLGNYWLVLDIYEMPSEIIVATADTTESPFPDDWVEAISWYALSFAYHSDQETGDNSLESDALSNYSRCLAKLQSFVTNINEDDPQGPQILTHRAFYEAAARNGGGYGYGGYD
jgi:hypothetical protein